MTGDAQFTRRRVRSSSILRLHLHQEEHHDKHSRNKQKHQEDDARTRATGLYLLPEPGVVRIELRLVLIELTACRVQRIAIVPHGLSRL
eukprot:CAMPEP_0115865474 /NCGR_PEP_ID=MMETSP0287-20121206/19739_1 /TAXON_ID=412157 /ORGANISM="Chrysochromulina rotalis, Strain UIO044" /LENGTH=88 /DNA_ID=CAMNT_0003319985 /DNA_START=79 /DNA_END=345 /DNA_ORIENTATION=+